MGNIIDRADFAFYNVESLLLNLTVEELPKYRKTSIVGSYSVPGKLNGIIVGVDNETGFQFGCAHIITGHEKVQKIRVADENHNPNAPVAIYKVLRGKGELYRNGKIINVKKGDKFHIMNNDSYCLAGDLVVAEFFEPVFTETTHLALAEDNPLIKTNTVGDTL